ncbi:YifB family Mg chelatase-like AAA ATPase [Gordonia jinghuaiqii]|uniref:YifB family Mg chelatase-like AAA ATPase n=1 Tax=Gordonia jinghuaiqii TaxID=2758710 RepID=A0A7D7QHY1_9ACTN|nr:YifB family Mg chelatase-like AAA ATPase [Gordonia jinghuaiqii]MCR5976158.1 YifB family Mg chelatase-like AAA ATPase [Gordonia jinghuaiqii]QMT03402.1 YifB family Mg chelatase-like AAA ATPase [Gordonia jinghuaiqii]
MLGQTQAVGLNAFAAEVVDVEASVSSGLPGFAVTGNPDASVREARDRVRAAIKNSEFKFPELKVTVALSPADMPKIGSGFDLSMALAILAATGQVPSDKLTTTIFLGELGLDGKLRPIRGVLPAVIAARQKGYRRAVVPIEVVAEAALVEGMDVGGATNLKEVTRWLMGDHVLDTVHDVPAKPPPPVPDMADVVGQHEARHALEIAAAGAHHVLMTGSPGIGKTMLARRLPGILPPLGLEDSLEVTAIHSLVGELSPGHPLVTEPPFIAPHHSSSTTALLGGGTGFARPGAVSKAHRGVLFLDECAEMSVKALESLREPLEDGEVRVPRRDGVAVYPARFQLILAANPCPCAPAHDVDCVCSAVVRRRYLGKLSGPLLDRVDIRVRMDPPGNAALMSGAGEASAQVRERVTAARATAVERWSEFGWRTNGEVPGSALRQKFRLPPDALRPIELFLRDGRVTARGADRALRLAWTLNDLRGTDRPTEDDVAQALMYRDRGATW